MPTRPLILLVVLAAALAVVALGAGCCGSYVRDREAFDAAMAERLAGLAARAEARADDVEAFVAIAVDPEAEASGVEHAGAALVRDLEADAAEARKLEQEARK